MIRRRQIALVAGTGIVLLAILGAVLARGGGAEAYRGSSPPAGLMLGDFSLQSFTGKRVSRESLRGKVVALTFLESKCKEACPVIAAQVAQGVELLSAEERGRIAPIAISTHPGDDTPESVHGFLSKQRAVGKLDYLIGTEEELRTVWKRFSVLSALDSGDADTHSASVRIFDRRGEWVSTLHPGVDLSPRNFAHDVRLALDEG